MPQQIYDPSSKWMIQAQGAGVLYVAGARNIVSCKAGQAEVVQPRKLPDGLLEARYAEGNQTGLFLVEVTTFPEKRAVKQICDDIRLVRQVRGILPESVVFCLCPKGRYRIPSERQERSKSGWTGETLSWRVVEVWTLSAEELLLAPNIGVVPWATLASFAGPTEVLLERCRERIETEGGHERENLLAVAQVFARLKYNKPRWLDIFGGKQAMIRSPIIQEIVEESERTGRVKAILAFLAERFTSIPPSVPAGMEHVKKNDSLDRLLRVAVNCSSVQAFEEALRQELPAPAPPSTRGRRRSRGQSS